MDDEILVFLLMVFVAVFMLTIFIVVPGFGTDRKTSKMLRGRVDDMIATLDTDSINLLKDRHLRNLSPLQRKLTSIPGMTGLAEKLEQAGKDYPAHRLLLLSIMFGVGGFMISLILNPSILLALIVFAVAFSIPFIRLNAIRQKRFNQFEEQLPEALEIMSRAMKAGHPFNESLYMVSQELENPIAEEYYRTYTDLNYGLDAKVAFADLVRRIPSHSLLSVVTAVLVQREVGGNLTEVFDQVAKIVRGRFQFQRKIKSLSAEGRMSAWILTLMPFVLALVLNIVNPEYMAVMLNNETGKMILIGAFIWMMLGILVIRSIIRIDI